MARINLVTAIGLFLYVACSRAEEVSGDRGTNEVCYRLAGETVCYKNEEPFNNAGGLLPQTPEAINTRFFLYSASGEATEIQRDSLGQVAALMKNTETKIVTHGYTDSHGSGWVQLIAKAMKSKGDVNFIAVDWNNGATGRYYQAVANCRLVGAEVASLVKALEKDCGIPLAKIHLIGHSLGAQVSGYAGKLLSNLGRITGLDPAGPAFYDNNSQVRLSKGDANYVDVIHTDDTGLGNAAQLGHADFYVNTGKHQPQCPVVDSFTAILKNFKVDFHKGVGCNHCRVLILLIMDIADRCSYQARPCTPGNICDTCGKGCVRMGMHSQIDSASGPYYVPTTDSEPFC